MNKNNVVKVKPAIGASVFHINQELEFGRYIGKSRNQEDMTKVFEKAVLQNTGHLQKEATCQLISFQRATKWLILLGQTVGLMPVLGVLTKPPTVMRFKVLSIRFLYSMTLFLSQSVISFICLLRMFRLTLSVKSIGFASFYISSAVTTILFIQVASKWPSFLKKFPQYKLDEYIDSRMEVKCNAAIAVFVILAVVEHILSEVAGFGVVMDSKDSSNLYKKFIEHAFPWIVELSIPNNLFISVMTQFLNVVSTLTWNYSDLFIVCLSIYLISILEGIKKKLIRDKTKYYCSSFWPAIREDFSRAAQLVRAFDDVISGVVFASFATNLFFICLQLYNLLSDGIDDKVHPNKHQRLSSGPFAGYENVIYFTYSMAFVLFRYLSVALIAARVPSAAQALAPVLYAVPAPAYCPEVQRFLDQIHHDTVALSGLQFFYVTKSLVLTVAGTIFTYELVLLQYGN